MQIKFLDLTKLNAAYFEEFNYKMRKIYFESTFICGDYVKKFEENFAQYLGVVDCVGVANGTDALEIAIKALRLPKGSQIIVPANTFKASCEAILNMGYKAVLVDCDEHYNINPKAILNALTPQTSAILVVHLYGRICDMLAIRKIAQDYGLMIIEDCSQAHGSRIKIDSEIQFAGSIGDIATFSFYPSKNLGAIGDAGCIVSQNNTFLERARYIANHCNGLSEKPIFVGRNSRLDEIQALILGLKLRDLDSHNAYRQKVASWYKEYLKDIEQIVLPDIPTVNYHHVWHQYVIRVQNPINRDLLRKFLDINGVQTHIHYPKSLNKILEFKTHINTILQHTPNASSWSESILSLPMGIHLEEKHIAFIAEKIKMFVQKV